MIMATRSISFPLLVPPSTNLCVQRCLHKVEMSFGVGDNLKPRPRGDGCFTSGLLKKISWLKSYFHLMTNSHTPSFVRCVMEMSAKMISSTGRKEKRGEKMGMCSLKYLLPLEKSLVCCKCMLKCH